jgi:hypothetical protein
VERWKLKVEAEFEGSTPPVMCLVQNKADLVDVASGGAAAAVVGAAEVEAMARKLGMPLFRTSVKLDVNVQAVFEYLAAQFIRRGQARSATSAGSGAFGAAAAGASASAAAAAAPAAPAAVSSSSAKADAAKGAAADGAKLATAADAPARAAAGAPLHAGAPAAAAAPAATLSPALPAAAAAAAPASLSAALVPPKVVTEYPAPPGTIRLTAPREAGEKKKKGFC